jgi:hypothetical protein
MMRLYIPDTRRSRVVHRAFIYARCCATRYTRGWGIWKKDQQSWIWNIKLQAAGARVGASDGAPTPLLQDLNYELWRPFGAELWTVESPVGWTMKYELWTIVTTSVYESMNNAMARMKFPIFTGPSIWLYYNFMDLVLTLDSSVQSPPCQYQYVQFKE